jgi:hypothetical protein
MRFRRTKPFGISFDYYRFDWNDATLVSEVIDRYQSQNPNLRAATKGGPGAVL